MRKARKRGHFHVTAGGRRLAAMQTLVAAGDLPADHPVRVIECASTDALEISLHENVTVETMHPLDEFEAFSGLVTERMSVAEIAARFGKTPAYIRQRMALARVSPLIREAYRREECSFELLAAFTVSGDHPRREAVWQQLASWQRYPHTIRRLLTESAIPGNDRRVSFVGGLEAYEAAGGPVRRDLFDAQTHAGYVLDEALLERLVAERLDGIAESVRTEGWLWVEARAACDWHSLSAFRRLDPEPASLDETNAAEFDALQNERDELEALLETQDDDEDGTHEARFNAVEALLDAYQRETFTPEVMAGAGAIVSIGYDGRPEVHRGLRRAEDGAGNETDPEAAFGAGDGTAARLSEATPEASGPVHSAVLLEDLTARKTAALRIALANNPDVALRAVVHALLLPCLYRFPATTSPLDIRAVPADLTPSLKSPDDTVDVAEWQSLAENHGAHLPGDPAALWSHLADLSRDELLDLLAFAASHTLNAVQKPHDPRIQARTQADLLAQALDLDMRRSFQVTGASYFQHINRAGIEAAVAEARGEEGRRTVQAATKKAEAVVIAERLLAGTGWLPAPLRSPRADEAAGPNT